MTRIENMIINYGFSMGTDKKCSYCERPNHHANTNCWYCNKDFKVNIR